MMNMANNAVVEFMSVKEITINAKSASSGLAFLLMRPFTLALLIVPTLFFSPLVLSQIEVVEAEPAIITDSRYPQAREISSAANTSNNAVNPSTNSMDDAPPPLALSSESGNAGLFVQLQDLQAEVRELRGLLEQQSYLIEQISQKRMDDYLDLDRRIGELSQSASSTAPIKSNSASNKPSNKPSSNTAAAQKYSTASVKSAVPAKVTSTSTTSSSKVLAVSSNSDIAKKAYRAASQKVKDRQFDEARVLLVAFIKAHPSSHYVPNAYFLLGELYYLDSDLSKAQQSFETLIKQHPSHRKIADAKFKLGKVYHQLGDNDSARSSLESVLNDYPGSTAANPAREYLNNSLR